MKIESITLSKEEIKTAICNYLKSCGIEVDVKGVDARGYPVKDYIVECNPVEKLAVPHDSTPLMSDLKKMIPAPLNILAHHETH